MAAHIHLGTLLEQAKHLARHDVRRLVEERPLYCDCVLELGELEFIGRLEAALFGLSSIRLGMLQGGPGNCILLLLTLFVLLVLPLYLQDLDFIDR